VFDATDLEDLENMKYDKSIEDMMDNEEDEEFGDEYKSEEELEDMISQYDTHSVYTQGSMVEQMQIKFDAHKKMKELLDEDLQ
jgi:hypothetical protein